MVLKTTLTTPSEASSLQVLTAIRDSLYQYEAVQDPQNLIIWEIAKEIDDLCDLAHRILFGVIQDDSISMDMILDFAIEAVRSWEERSGKKHEQGHKRVWGSR